MSALLQAELLKLRTTRTFVALVGTAAGLSLLAVLLITLLSDAFGVADVAGLFSVDFTTMFILLLGVMGMSGEWRHRTITGTVLAAPDRIRLLAAKAIAYAIAGAVLSLVVSLLGGLVGTLILSIRDFEVIVTFTDVLDILWRNLVTAALLGAFGVCVGAIVRNQVVAIVGILFFSFVVEVVVFSLAPEVGRYGPTRLAPAGLENPEFSDDDDAFALLGQGAAVLVMMAWVAVAFAIGAVTLKRRDLV